MTKTVHVRPAHVVLAQLALELSEHAGEKPDEALIAIANARVVAPEHSAPSHRASGDGSASLEVIDRLARIEHQLQQLSSEVLRQEQSQTATQPEPPTSVERSIERADVQHPTLATTDRDDLDKLERHKIQFLESEHPGGTEIGPEAENQGHSRPETEDEHPGLSRAMWQRLQREQELKRRREQVDPDTEGRDPNPRGPWSGGIG